MGVKNYYLLMNLPDECIYGFGCQSACLKNDFLWLDFIYQAAIIQMFTDLMFFSNFFLKGKDFKRG